MAVVAFFHLNTIKHHLDARTKCVLTNELKNSEKNKRHLFPDFNNFRSESAFSSTLGLERRVADVRQNRETSVAIIVVVFVLRQMALGKIFFALVEPRMPSCKNKEER